MAAALAVGDSSLVTGNEIRAALRSQAASVTFQQTSIVPDIWGNVTGASWSPSHDSVWLQVEDDALAVPFIVSNWDYKSPDTNSRVLAAAGSVGQGRFVAYGGNVIAGADTTVTNRSMYRLLNQSIAWALHGGVGGLNVTTAHLPGASSYWFNHDVPTRAWLLNNLPRSRVNAINTCDGPLLPACLATSQLLVISNQYGQNDDSLAPYVDTNGAAVAQAVEAFLRRGGAVLYMHYYRDCNSPVCTALMPLFGLGTPQNNYWTVDGIKDASVASVTTGSGPSAAAGYVRIVDALTGVTPLTEGDLAGCVDAGGSSWAGCSNANFTSKLGSALLGLRSTLGAFDSGGRSLFATPGRASLKLAVMLGDKYRANGSDAGTTPLTYPVPVDGGYGRYAALMFADASVLYRRSVSPPQDDMGSLYCPLVEQAADACAAAGYDYRTWAGRVPLLSGVAVTNAVPDSSVWTTTGLFALPGVSFTVSRTDSAPVDLAIYLWHQREGTTKALMTRTMRGVRSWRYTRPQWVRSPSILVPRGGANISITSPYGGPIYIGFSGQQAAAVGAPATLLFSRVARHPAILDVGDDAQVAAFVTDMATNPIPTVSLRAPAFEIHSTSWNLRASLRSDYDLLVDYGGGASGLRTLLDDVRFNYVDQVYGLAGFKLPGRTLAATLPAPVRSVCASLGWNCSNDALHRPPGIQHANYDIDATCGSGCSGNPFDADWSVTPLGWGESHELGHNLQIGANNIHYVPSSLGSGGRNSWANYANRAGENSNNIFPYHTLWNYYRRVRNYTGPVDAGHMDHKDTFAVIQVRDYSQSAVEEKRAERQPGAVRVFSSWLCLILTPPFPHTPAFRSLRTRA